MHTGDNALSLVSRLPSPTAEERDAVDEHDATEETSASVSGERPVAKVRGLVVVRDEATFMRSPNGRCFVHSSFLMWRASSRLSGLAFWGAPTVADAAIVTRLLLARHELGFADVATITDTRGLTALEPDTFAAMASWVQARTAAAEGRLGRSFLLLDPTPSSAVVSKVSASFGTGMRAAKSYLDVLTEIGHDDAVALAAVLEATVGDARAEKPLLGALREHVRANLAAASVTSSARALATSPRSLQRALANAGTSFVREVTRIRVKEAASLLARSDWKIERIAAHVGFSSTSHFRAVFQQEMGTQPSVYRAREAAKSGAVEAATRMSSVPSEV